MKPSARTLLSAALLLGIAGTSVAGCSAVDATAVKAHRSNGVTRRYDRPPAEVYAASLAAVDRIRAEEAYWSGLRVIEQDPVRGTIVAQQSLDSAVIPGLGTKDAIGIFVADAPAGSSDVTVVALASDQIPGGVGATLASLNGAEAFVFPAIDASLPPDGRSGSSSETGRVEADAEGASTAAPPRAPGTATSRGPAAPPAGAAPTALAESSRAASSSRAAAAQQPRPNAAASLHAPLLDRAYEVLRASQEWRPLVREAASGGAEEIRIADWATLVESSDRLHLRLREGKAPPAQAARLALELDQAGLPVEVESDSNPAPRPRTTAP